MIGEAVGEFVLKFTVALGVVLVVSFLSLGWRTGIVVALAVPLTLAGVFVVMDLMGIELQRISLGALILSLGLLVDDAIIAIETMVVKLDEGWDRVRAATFAWTSTAFPMLTGTLVTAAAFLPVGLANSSTGEYAGGIFWVVSLALVISWVVPWCSRPISACCCYRRRNGRAATTRSTRRARTGRCAAWSPGAWSIGGSSRSRPPCC